MDLINYLIRFKIISLLKKWNILNIILGAIDILAITIAFQCSYIINYSDTGGFFFGQRTFVFLYLGVLPLWLIILYLIKVAEIPRTKRYWVLFLEYLQSTLLILILLLVIYFVFKLYLISRLFLIEFDIIGFIFLFIERLIEFKVFKAYRSRGYNYINIALIADDSALPFIDNLLIHKEWGYRIFAIFTASELIKKRYEKTIILLPEEFLAILSDLMEHDIIDEVIYMKNRIIPAEVRETVRSCEELGVIFRLNARHNNNLTTAINTEIGNEKFLTFINVPHHSFALAIKTFMDISISLFLMILLLPLILIIVILIKTSSPGPLIFKHKRVGLRGRQFDLYKFRTMILGAEELRKDLADKNEVDGPVFKIKDDPRITKIGKLLRKTGLDELPQLINILKGEMSLIGPRPPLPEETKFYKRWQLRRLSVRPGLSCFWQIKPDRNSIKFEKWMEMDLAYIDNWSPRLDFLIFLKTIKTVIQRTGL